VREFDELKAVCTCRIGRADAGGRRIVGKGPHDDFLLNIHRAAFCTAALASIARPARTEETLAML